MNLSEYNYMLPKELIAQEPVFPKDHSKLMVLNKTIEHKHFYDIINYLEKDDVLVVNESRVKKCKLIGKKSTGAEVEVIIEKQKGALFECRIHGSSAVKIHNALLFENTKGLVVGKDGEKFLVQFNNSPINENLHLPQPPYIKRLLSDREYQTTYSSEEGSLAAPTAGLHFTEELLKKIEQKGVKIAKIKLHVSFGTFKPIRTEVNKHKMDPEEFIIDKPTADLINNAKRLFVVGTTSLKALESANQNGKIIPQHKNSKLFICPGYKFKTKVKGLITNFHFPKSTLLLLVSAFYGKEKILDAYEKAIKHKYRFFSLGDAMLLLK